MGSLQTSAEREQMDKIINYLEKEFKNSKENCILIIEPEIPEKIGNITINRKPDALIIKDNVFCIIEMKGYFGNIIADCGENAQWRSKEGKVIQIRGSRNPFQQARSHRRALLIYLTDFFSNGDTQKKGNKRWPKSNVQSWVITGEASNPEIVGIDSRKNPFFKVLPPEQLPNSLMFHSTDHKLTSTNIEKIISSFKATRVSKKEWLRSISKEYLEQTIGLIPKITQLMNTENGNNHLTALKYIQELDLTQHRPHVIKSWEKSPHPEIRQKALFMLTNWQDNMLGSIFNEALIDSSQEIVDFSLEYLSKDGYSETFDTLTSMLNTDQQSNIAKILRAITSSGHPRSCQTIYGYAKKTVFNKPFEPFRNIRENYYQSIKDGTKKEKRDEYFDMRNKETRILKLIRLIIDCLGDVQCRESVSWLTEIITSPTSIGFITDDFMELDQNTDFIDVFSSACIALEKIGFTNVDLSSFLLDKLTKSPEDFQYYIIELMGSLEITQAVPKLKPFLQDQRNRLYIITVKALVKIMSNEAFDILAEAYTFNPDSYEGIITGEALGSINRERFVDLILEQLQTKEVSTEFKRMYLQTLLGSVSLKCADTLFNYLKNNKLSEMAAWNLTFLMNNDHIFDRAMKLTQSKNPIEQSGAMWALDKHFIKNPDELERFESENAHKTVRRAVASFYSQSDSKQKLFNYAKDSDKEVRETVFRYFTDKAYFGEFFVTSDSRKKTAAKVAIEDDYLGINLNKEIVLIPKKNIIETVVSTYEEYYYGLYLEIEKPDTFIEHMLLVPRREQSVFAQARVTKLKSEINSNRSTDTIKDPTISNNLWATVKKSLPKKQQHYRIY